MAGLPWLQMTAFSASKRISEPPWTTLRVLMSWNGHSGQYHTFVNSSVAPPCPLPEGTDNVMVPSPKACKWTAALPTMSSLAVP
jgi:hypothetical protein